MWPAECGVNSSPLTTLAMCLWLVNSLHNHLWQCWVLEIGVGKLSVALESKNTSSKLCFFPP